MDASCRHTYIHKSIMLRGNSNNIFKRCDFVCTAVKRIRMSESCHDWVVRFKSNTSCLTQVTDNHKSQCVKVFQKHFLLVKLKTVRKSTGYQYLKKSLSLSFSLLLFPLADFYNRIDSLSLPLQDSGCFLFSFEILRGKLKHGRQELIPSRMPNVWPLCFMPQVLWINTIF